MPGTSGTPVKVRGWERPRAKKSQDNDPAKGPVNAFVRPRANRPEDKEKDPVKVPRKLSFDRKRGVFLTKRKDIGAKMISQDWINMKKGEFKPSPGKGRVRDIKDRETGWRPCGYVGFGCYKYYTCAIVC